MYGIVAVVTGPFSHIEKFQTFNVQRYPIGSTRFVTSSESARSREGI